MHCQSQALLILCEEENLFLVPFFYSCPGASCPAMSVLSEELRCHRDLCLLQEELLQKGWLRSTLPCSSAIK